jgi:ribonuclease P protein component
MLRLKRRADFLAAAAGVKAHAGGFVLQARNRREDGPVRVGITCSKQVGNAVERNRVRRRLREAIRLSPVHRFRGGYDYVLIGRRTALELPFASLVDHLNQALERVHDPLAASGGRQRGPARSSGRGKKSTERGP